jgi:hypothetical protein
VKAVILAAAALMAVGGAARAAEPSDADIRCVTVAFMIAGTAKDDDIKNAATITSFYFLGKIDGAAPGAELESRIRTAITTMSPNDYGEEGKRCGAELAKRGGDLQVLGEHLRSLGDQKH